MKAVVLILDLTNDCNLNIILDRKSMDAIRKQVKKEYSPCDSCEFKHYLF